MIGTTLPRTLRAASLSALLLAPLPLAGQSIDRLLEQGRVDEALPRIEAALEQNPRDARALLQRSTARFIQGDHQGGKADLERALALDPTLRQGWLNRGGLALAEEDYETAWKAFQRAAELDPRATDNDLNLGTVRLLQGRLSDAAGLFTRYLQRNARSGEAHYLVATNYALAGLAGPAITTLERAIALDERMRRRARTDANFADLAADPRFERLLSVDLWRPPAGWHTTARTFEAAYEAGDGPLLKAVLDALQEGGTPFDPRVEVTDEWAIVWAEARIKVSPAGAERGRVELAGSPERFSSSTWESWSDELLRQITVRLASQQLRRRQEAAPSGG